MYHKRFTQGDRDFIVWVDEATITITEDDGSTFNFCLMPLSLWNEIARWVQDLQEAIVEPL